jgi:chemotaxis protein MotB
VSKLNIIVSLVTLSAFPACVSQDKYQRVLHANEALQEERDSLAENLRELQDRNQRLAGDVERLGKSAAEAAWLEQQKARLQEMIDKLGAGGSLEIPGVTVRRSDEGIVVEVQGEVLFASGKAEVTPSGRETLRKLAATLRNDTRRLRIEGHTDTDPIVHSPWRTNLRLSAERAMAVAEALIAEGVPDERVGVAGYGEHKPNQPGNGAEAKQANRRVEILLIDR